MPSKPKSDGKKAARPQQKQTEQHSEHNTHEEESMSHQEDFTHHEDASDIDHYAPAAHAAHTAQTGADAMAGSSTLNLEVSRALRKRLEMSARDEGVSVEDLASELLAEGLVLRAWEIVERKSAMRGGGSPQQIHQQQQRQGNVRHGGGHGGNHGGNKQGGGNNKHGGGRMNKRHAAHAASLNLMEDKAAFLEYVRNQERKNHNR